MLVYDHQIDEYRPPYFTPGEDQERPQRGQAYEVTMKHCNTGAEIVLTVEVPPDEPDNRWQALYQAYLQLGLDLNCRPGFSNPWIFTSAVKTKKPLTLREASGLSGNPDLELQQVARQLPRKIQKTTRNIYNHQGYYSALAFLVNAGYASWHDQDEAEKVLESAL